MFKEFINMEQEEIDHDYIVVKTLKVPLILQRGNPKLIEFLSSIMVMPY